MDKDRLQMYISLTKITIVLCWLSLFSFWVIKLFGYNLFEIMVENENFIKFSQIVQNTWVKYLVSFITMCYSNYFFIGAITQRFVLKGKFIIIFLFSTITMWIIANFVPIDFLKMTYGYFIMILIGIIFQKGWKKIFGLLSVALEFVFTTVSLLTRNISLMVSTDYLTMLILLIDIYIMIALFYLYTNLIRLNKEK